MPIRPPHSAKLVGPRRDARFSIMPGMALAETLPRAIVVVEGLSDLVAVETLARRLGRDLPAEDVSVVPIGGAKNIGAFLAGIPAGVELAGLCDVREERDFRRALERAGLGSRLSRDDLERLGFYICEADLEDELIRALGAEAVEDVIRVRGDLHSFRTLQKQPAQRDRTREAQLRRFMGTRGGRKIEYAELLVEALDLGRVPRPLERVLAHVTPSPR
jgi:hypothetical protein